MANTQIVLLEHVDSLGRLGDVVTVKPGYARNFLLPEGKALRATKENLKVFETRRKQLEEISEKKSAEAEKSARDLDGLNVVMIRQAGESGQLYGSVAARDIAEIVNETGKVSIGRSQVVLNTNIKTIGLFDVTIALYGDIKAKVNINVARSEAEAEIQAKTGTALITADEDETPVKTESAASENSAEEATAEAETEAPAENAEDAEENAA